MVEACFRSCKCSQLSNNLIMLNKDITCIALRISFTFVMRRLGSSRRGVISGPQNMDHAITNHYLYPVPGPYLYDPYKQNDQHVTGLSHLPTLCLPQKSFSWTTILCQFSKLLEPAFCPPKGVPHTSQGNPQKIKSWGHPNKIPTPNHGYIETLKGHILLRNSG